jgi:hypothetical protein
MKLNLESSVEREKQSINDHNATKLTSDKYE